MAAMAEVGNPSSVHGFGRAARRWIEDARERVAAMAGARAADVVFTSGGGEANNLALGGSGCRRHLISAVEHGSVLAAAPGAILIPVDRNGIVDLAALRHLLGQGERPALVSIMLANNETGVLQPITEAAELAHAAGAWLHCDAVQAAGRRPIDLMALGPDYLTLSAHKLGGPPGVGALVMRPDAPLVPALRGGGQERGRRAGTENVAGIAGFGRAAALAGDDLADQPRLAALRDRLQAGIQAIDPEARAFGADAPRLANTLCMAMPGVTSETQVIAFDLAGVAVSAGAACSSGKVAASHVLAAMGVDLASALTAIRISLGWATQGSDIDHCLDVWRNIHGRARTRVA